MSRRGWTIGVDMTKCEGRGICAELLPERITLDDWGYPIIDGSPLHGLTKRHARRAVAGCPELALFLERAGEH
ncbi:MAG TPA: ferredoxin [Acidimicrobiales bacterium]|nr:ferredoxin [Acidimicrobiales bacterium]